MGQQRDVVLAGLRELITHGTYRPDQFFSESEVMERFRVSRAPIREALAVLSQEGLIEQYHRKGVRVRTISGAEALEVLRLRRHLEEIVVKQLATSGNPERLLEGVDEVLSEMDAAIAEGNVAAYLDADTEFHCGLAHRAGYRAAADMLRTLRAKIRIIGLDSVQQEEGLEGANDGHRELIAAIMAQDAGRAQRILTNQLDATSKSLVHDRHAAVAPDLTEVRRLVEQARQHRVHDGEYRQAAEVLETAVAQARQSSSRQYLVQVLLELASTRRQAREFTAASELAEEALSISRADHYQAGEAWAKSHLGRIALETGSGGKDELDEARALLVGLPEPEVEGHRGWNHYALAISAARQHKNEEAVSEAQYALDIFERERDDEGRARCLLLLAQLAMARGDSAQASGLLDESLTIATDKKLRPTLAAAKLQAAVQYRTVSPEEAENVLREAYDMFKEMDDFKGMNDALRQLSGVGETNAVKD